MLVSDVPGIAGQSGAIRHVRFYVVVPSGRLARSPPAPAGAARLALSALSVHPYAIVQSIDDASTDDASTRALAAAGSRWSLSARECEVLAHLAEGDANKEIAAKLSCALRTVEAHVTSILKKARCAIRAQVVARFWRWQK